MMRVRCFCGRYMGFVGHELATAASGGRDEHRCASCGARASIWHAHRTDDQPVGGILWNPVDGREAALVWNDEREEWRRER